MVNKRFSKLSTASVLQISLFSPPRVHDLFGNIFNNSFLILSRWFNNVLSCSLKVRTDINDDVSVIDGRYNIWPHARKKNRTTLIVIELINRALSCEQQLKRPEVNALSAAAEELSKSGAEADVTAAAAEKLKSFRDRWNELETAVVARVKLGQTYVAFHKKAQQVRTPRPGHPRRRRMRRIRQRRREKKKIYIKLETKASPPRQCSTGRILSRGYPLRGWS